MAHPLIFLRLRHKSRGVGFRSIVLLVSGILVGGEGTLLAQQASQEAAPTPPGQGQEAPEAAPKLSNDQLEALVAPIALYPDPLLAQCLVASTYPVEVIQAQQWLAKNPSLKGDELTQAAQQQDWDPSVQALVSIPDALKRLSEDIKWTTDLGDAFLAQQSDVMDAVQRLRGKAKDSGKLASSDQQKVETQIVEEKTIVVIQPASTEVVYVPTYSPTVIWGVYPYYPYPPLYYPPYYGGAWVGFGVGIAIGIGISGGWGWGCGWHGGNNTININNNNNYIRNGNRGQAQPKSGTSNWQHNAHHRGGTPYNNKATANQYGGSARGESRGAGSAASTRGAGGSGGFGGPSPSTRDAGGGRAGSSGSSGFAGAGGGDKVGGRSVSSPGHSGSGFSGSSGGSRGANMSSSRGSSSFSGGGMRGGGGGRRR